MINKYRIYYLISLISILLVVMFRHNLEILRLNSYLYIISTTLITLKLVNRNDEREDSKIYTPTKYYERKGSYNRENYVRAILLIIFSVVIFISNDSNLAILLIIAWVTTITSTIISFERFPNGWNFISESIFIEMNGKITKSQAVKIVEILDQKRGSSQLDGKISIEDEKRIKLLYKKLTRELEA